MVVLSSANGELALFMLYAILYQLSFSSSLPYLCRKDQARSLLQCKKTFSKNVDASGCFQSYAKTLSWNRSTDCCSWDGVYCNEMIGHIIELDLSCSQIQGKFHSNNSLFRLSNLRRLDLSFNDFSGSHILPKFGGLSNLTHLDIWGSRFTGDNELNDIFPKWLGTLPNLKPLSLKSNKLHGPIKASKNKKLFAQLQIMDLSSNLFSGNLPVNIFENFQAMKIFYENVRDPWNKFEGYIPSIIGDLTVLCTLNLSHNHLEGLIPASLHQLSVIESLDLSFNKIGGGILQQLGFLTSLEALNLSHNHLVGCVPKGKQYDTFEKSSYQGNDGLHGFPLSKDCGAYERIAISSMISKRKNKMNTQIYLENFDGKKHGQRKRNSL
ncbi:putative glutaredoxin-C5-like [Capsicum annuum]|uniref:Leucine-rich repeat-containing N-terminal plant-type domain-containing protein n=1 Tax=Capsicum annuum TaxID=4072 RepID=A0A2G3ANC4_CAPAN|nr:putative glutaredoxin-C5-like [Capsicum annuum]KAF3672897.1 putative glutaredoxin-C5-like [Capsicum annuum]PHT95737.1 hypothetical protein T459_03619 [Capsicum annuum]